MCLLTYFLCRKLLWVPLTVCCFACCWQREALAEVEDG